MNLTPPFFCTTDVPMSVSGEHMQQFCRDNDLIFTSKRLLISGMKAQKILIATPLLQWYLMHSCKVTKIYQLVEFIPNKSFISQGDTA